MSSGWVSGSDRSVLVAVEPVVLEGVLAFLIARRQQGQVVEFHSTPDALARSYDAALVSCPAPPDVRADVVICLPAGGAGRTSVTKNGNTEWTVVNSHHDVVQLLNEQRAGGVSRT